ncbi:MULTISPECIES: ABC transporter ATP-binding protein [Pacificibacter]|uniref:ABC transporter ATP-binding protein n=1 Tax=Pacificibacter TaxID=1042323 RepID=UPI001C07F9EA|nr:sn-glycerol-3-phosphate ABC transporter ATP-binding protein UgpC [Pacificibacter sp. 1_MG-2023]MBU2937169.1 sn-glycerol-3-phosphate ABC transporter ATP-binding protein UgpC [Pacificibacter marinus]MDO6617011.1 sn-glycerol-3-phosphate ABC transporter ATP-binding protein UgpC [Pacificibacter sp. 1_MG-2023]
MATLNISDIRKSYGANVILNGINIDLEHGDFLVLLGPSGCGKSTLLNMIAGLESIDSGEVSIADRVVNRVHPKDRDIAMVFQSYALYPNMTVGKNITFGMQRRKIPKAEQEKALSHVAGLLQIENLLDRRPAQLSGGQRQRVAMGRALVRDPHVFLFDEPLSNLDAKLRGEMRTEIKRLHQRLGATIVYVTHDQVEAMTLATQVAVMKAGEIQQYGPPQEIYAKPANMFVAGFIGAPAMNFIPATVTVDDAGGYGLIIQQSDARGGDICLSLKDYETSDLSRYLGHEVILGLRPEDISRYIQNGAAAPDDIFTCQVDVVEPTGADTLITISLGGKAVTARFPPKHAGTAGDEIVVHFNMIEASLFDAKTQDRI